MNIQSLKQIPFMARLLVIYIWVYRYGLVRGDTTDAFLMGGLMIALVIAAIPNIISKLHSKKKDAELVDTITVNAALLRGKLDSGKPFELIINNESIDLVVD